jgi:hypothetical protein
MNFGLDYRIIIVLAAILFLAVVFVFARGILPRKTSGLNVEKYRSEWLKIENSLDRNNKMTYQMAVLLADKLLDRAMRDSRIPGDTMGERLKTAKNRFTNINDIWFAHKLRNRIAHETDINLNFVVTKKALFIFKKALKELGAI